MAVLAEPFLVGREKELEELGAFLNSASEGKGKTVFIVGEAGSGKTRLVHEFLKGAKKRGMGVLIGWCLSDAATPYFPFVEAFRSFFASSEEEEQLSPSLPEPGVSLSTASFAQVVGGERGIAAWLTGSVPLEKPGRTEIVSPQIWKDQVFAGVTDTLHTISTKAPVVLFLEDIHWADSASLALLHYIARAVNGVERILVLATFRGEELTADAEGHPHPLAETLRIMRREDLFTEINVQSLSQRNVAEIAKNMIGGNLQPQLAEKLAAESRGNPLFVVESMRMLNERKSLVQENNEWRLAIDEFGIPSKIKDIILRRLAVLKYAQRRVLDAASVIGEKFNVELLSTVLGLDILDTLETLNVIAHATSLVSVDEDCYRFDHARSRETLYEELSPPLKRGYHLRVAERIESTSKEGKLPFSDLAYHYAQAGNTEKAEKCALAAGKDALERFSNTEAIKHFTFVLQTASETPENAQARVTALEGLGDAYYAGGRYEDAIKTFDSLANSAVGVTRQRAYIKEMEAVWFKGSNPSTLLELAKKAEEHVIDRLGIAHVRHNRGRALLHMRDLPGTLKEHEEALRIFKEEYYLPKTADLLFAIGTIHVMLQMQEKGFGEMLQGLQIFHELGDARGEMMVAHRGLATFFLAAGLPQEATNYYTLAFQIGEKIGAYDDMAIAYDWLGAFQLISGNPESALSHTLKALEYSEKTDATRTKYRLYGSLVMRYSRVGDLAHAEEYYGKFVSAPKEVLSPLQSGNFEFAETALLCAKGLWKEAEDHFERMKTMPIFSAVVWQIAIRNLYAWALGKQGKNEQAKSLLDEVQRLISDAERRFARAIILSGMMAKKEVTVGEEFELRLDLVNVARSSGLLTLIEELIPDGFKVNSLPDFCSVQSGNVEMKEKTIGPFQVMPVKLKLKATKPGNYELNPSINYIDDLGENKTFKPEPIAINVHSATPSFETLPNRVTTGYLELDRLLLGGIPQNHAIILSSPSIDERALLITKFLEAGTSQVETTVYITVEAGYMKTLAEQNPSNFYLLICNPQVDVVIQNLPNVFKLKGIESLTEVDIALTKMFRTMPTQSASQRRICIEIISDALLQHHAVNTRRWLSALIPTLKSKGFTVLAVINPQMHPPEESQAIRSLFDGEIEVAEKGQEKTMRIRRLINQRYLEEEVSLTKEKLES